MAKTGRRSRGGLAAQVKENVPGRLGRRADVRHRRAPTDGADLELRRTRVSAQYLAAHLNSAELNLLPALREVYNRWVALDETVAAIRATGLLEAQRRPTEGEASSSSSSPPAAPAPEVADPLCAAAAAAIVDAIKLQQWLLA